MNNRIAEIILSIALILLTIVALGFSIGIQSLTIIEWWKPAVLCAVISLPISIWLARYIVRLTASYVRYLEYPAAFILSFSILLGTFYYANYFL